MAFTDKKREYEYKKRWAQDNAEKVRASRKRWDENNREKVRELNRIKSARRRELIGDHVREVQRLWRSSHPRKSRAGDIGRADNLRYNYGITPEQYDEMLAAQGGRCAICGTDDPRHHGRFCVDHDHDTGRVRSLLCSVCNTRVGVLEGAYLPDLLKYLEKHYGEHDS